MERLMKIGLLSAITLGSIIMTGCSSPMVSIAPKVSNGAQRIGHVEGSASGMLGVAGTAYYFIPMGLNSRYDRAYNNALAKAPGATSLTDVTIQENWYWLVLGTLRHVTISGEAVQ